MPNTTVYTNNQYYQDIATAIRNKNGQSTLYKPSEMAPAIDSLVVSGQQVTLQNKTVTPTTSAQTITKDAGYTGLGTVTVNAIPSQYIVPAGTMTITNNGTYAVKWYASVDVDVDAGDVINNQSKTVDPTETRQYITYDADYTGLEQVIVEPISSTYIGSGISRKSATDLTVSGATVSVPAGYYSATASKSVATATQAVPAITVSTTGLITATATQTAGYVSGGTKTTTHQLSVQSATTITPTESEQTAVVAGKYTTGAITVAAIPNSYVGSGVTTRSAADLSIAKNNITAPAGYYASNVTATITQYDLIAPTIVLTNSTGQIQSTATITASKSGYYASQFATGTLSLTTQTGTTITPKATSQTAVAQYRWTTGAITVAAVPTDTNNSFSANGTYTPESGKWFSSVTVDVPSDINNQAKTATPTTATQTIKPDSSYSGLSQVTINPIPSNYITTSDANATASHILINKTAYVNGSKVTGSMPNNGATGGTITTQGGKYTIPAGYTSGGTVTASLPVSTITNGVLNVATVTEATGDYGVQASITIPAGYYSATTLSKVLSTVLPAPATAISASQMLAGYQAYNNEGQLLTGTMTNQEDWGATLDQTTTSVTIPEGYHDGTGKVSHTTVNIPDPAFSMNNSTGVITASNTWTRGFTTDNSYSNTYSLTTQAGKTITPTESAQTAVASYRWTTGTITVAAIPSDYVGSGITTRSAADLTASDAVVSVPAGYYATTVSKSVTTTNHQAPTVTISSNGVITASHTQETGYVTGGTTSSTLTLSVRSSLNTNGATITASAGYYPNAVTTTVAAMTLPTSAVTTSAGTAKATITRSTATRYINIPVGYNSTAAHYVISAVANGTVIPPTAITGSQATVTAGTNVLTFSKSISVTPNVTTAGYISAGTASNVTVTLSAAVTTKAAATYTPGTTTQTIAANQYLTGAQTIAGDADLVASNIKSGVNIFGVNGTFTSDATATAADIVDGETAYVNGSKIIGSMVVNYYYTGSTSPSASLGNNGDIYLQE